MKLYDVKEDNVVSHWNVRPSEVRGWSSQLSNYPQLCQTSVRHFVVRKLCDHLLSARRPEKIFLEDPIFNLMNYTRKRCFLWLGYSRCLSWFFTFNCPGRDERGEGSYEKCIRPSELFFIREGRFQPSVSYCWSSGELTDNSVCMLRVDING